MGRPLEDGELKFLVTDLLNSDTERDKQTKVGASQIGNPCDFCLANALRAHGQRENPWWMGARIGTAIHEALERAANEHIDTPREGKFNALKGARLEEKIILGTIPGYGTIKSKPDMVLVEHDHLVDYKTTTKAKLNKMRATGAVSTQYIYQQQLYAWGLNSNGVTVKRISLVFIARDGSGANDVWVYSFDYDPELAKAAWDRVTAIWKFLEGGGTPEDLDSHEDCWYCSNVLGRV